MPLHSFSTVRSQKLQSFHYHPCQPSYPLPSIAISQLLYLYFHFVMDDNTDILFCNHNEIQVNTKIEYQWQLERKRQDSHYLRQLYHIFPVGTYLCIYKFLDSLEKDIWAHYSVYLWGGRRKWDGSGWPKGTSASSTMFYFLKRRMNSCFACVIKL